MVDMFAKRMKNMPRSFIRDILKLTQNPELISFAGGLPNPSLFPLDAINKSSQKILGECGKDALQYSLTEGYYPLRQYLSERYYKKWGLVISPEEILITNGSQQGLDLLGKVFIDEGDRIIIEKPGYLGAIQAFSAYQPVFRAVELMDDGIDLKSLLSNIIENNPKMVYTVPNFQNPSGISYSLQKRKEMANIINSMDMVLIEDDPYGELRFIGEELPPIKFFASNKTILLGSFSKIVAPGIRLGWICAKEEMMENLVIAKQGADLHSNYFAQRVICQFLMDYDLDAHIDKIKHAYKKQRDIMVETIEKCFPKEVVFTKPEGGMFLWGNLPYGISSMELFNEALKDNVAFVPGNPFYVNGDNVGTFRLNYTNSDSMDIINGITRLSDAYKRLLNKKV
jgi:2-aminoadipate transaminase